MVTSKANILYLAVIILCYQTKFFEATIMSSTESNDSSNSATGTTSDNELASFGAAGNCGFRFTMKAMYKNYTSLCVELVGMNMANFPPTRQDLYKIHYNDKCFSKCYLMHLKFLTESDNFDRLAIMDDIKTEVPHDNWPDRLAAINNCIQYTEDMASEEGGVTHSPCKYSLVFLMCMRESEMEMAC